MAVVLGVQPGDGLSEIALQGGHQAVGATAGDRVGDGLAGALRRVGDLGQGEVLGVELGRQRFGRVHEPGDPALQGLGRGQGLGVAAEAFQVVGDLAARHLDVGLVLAHLRRHQVGDDVVIGAEGGHAVHDVGLTVSVGGCCRGRSPPGSGGRRRCTTADRW